MIYEYYKSIYDCPMLINLYIDTRYDKEYSLVDVLTGKYDKTNTDIILNAVNQYTNHIDKVISYNFIIVTSNNLDNYYLLKKLDNFTINDIQLYYKDINIYYNNLKPHSICALIRFLKKHDIYFDIYLKNAKDYLNIQLY